MVKRSEILAVVLCVLGVCTAINAQSVSGSIESGKLTRGTAGKATVVLLIPGGLHVNSNRPNSEYAIATTVRASSRGVKIGSVSYPRGHNRKFEFSEKPINVYESKAAFTFPVTVPAGYKGKTVRINATVHYQACTHEVCYPPKSVPVTLTARVL